jgi:CheY-specific phosphatase CheX
MQNINKKILTRVSESIFEQVAFIFTNETGPQCKPQSSGWNALGAELRFSGACSGTARLWMAVEVAKCIASNMLALDCSADIEKANDAVSELCNIISGNFITEAYQNSDIVLHIPLPLDISDLKSDFDNPDGVWFSTDDGPILIIVKEI